MFELTVVKVGTDKSVTVKGSHRSMVIDHLEASAARHGLEVAHIRDNLQGDILKNGQIVAEWAVTVE
uniref:Gp84-like domain-containing protein n=1 Tax=Mycobacterium phage BabyBack TaxID=3158877 RepID=A0AAU8GR28_9CAUD